MIVAQELLELAIPNSPPVIPGLAVPRCFPVFPKIPVPRGPFFFLSHGLLFPGSPCAVPELSVPHSPGFIPGLKVLNSPPVAPAAVLKGPDVGIMISETPLPNILDLLEGAAGFVSGFLVSSEAPAVPKLSAPNSHPAVSAALVLGSPDAGFVVPETAPSGALSVLKAAVGFASVFVVSSEAPVMPKLAISGSPPVVLAAAVGALDAGFVDPKGSSLQATP